LIEAVKEDHFLRPLVEQIVQQIPEADMDETVGQKRASAQPIGGGTGVDIIRGR